MTKVWTTPAITFYKRNFTEVPVGIHKPGPALLAKWSHMLNGVPEDKQIFVVRALETDAACLKLISNAKRKKEFQRLVKESGILSGNSINFFSDYYELVVKKACEFKE